MTKPQEKEGIIGYGVTFKPKEQKETKCYDCGCKLELETEEDLTRTDLRCEKCFEKMRKETDLEQKETIHEGDYITFEGEAKDCINVLKHSVKKTTKQNYDEWEKRMAKDCDEVINKEQKETEFKLGFNGQLFAEQLKREYPKVRELLGDKNLIKELKEQKEPIRLSKHCDVCKKVTTHIVYLDDWTCTEHSQCCQGIKEGKVGVQLQRSPKEITSSPDGSQSDLVKEFIKANPKPEFYMPEDYIIHRTIANTPVFIREYFEWLGKKKGGN